MYSISKTLPSKDQLKINWKRLSDQRGKHLPIFVNIHIKCSNIFYKLYKHIINESIQISAFREQSIDDHQEISSSDEKDDMSVGKPKHTCLELLDASESVKVTPSIGM